MRQAATVVGALLEAVYMLTFVCVRVRIACCRYYKNESSGDSDLTAKPKGVVLCCVVARLVAIELAAPC